jgi:hypothetical protein
MMKATFKGTEYEVRLTDHVSRRMFRRNVTLDEMIEVIETGDVKDTETMNKYYVYKALANHPDNDICFVVEIRAPGLVVVTVMHYWEAR